MRLTVFGLCLALLCPALAGAQTLPDARHMQSRTALPLIANQVPGPNQPVSGNFIRVAARNTPSGFVVPRYVSLKYNRSRGRTGPSSEYPVAWEYKRTGLPLIVVAETETWRKVRDVNGDESWMNRRLLDGKRMVLARSEIVLRAKPRSDSGARANVAKGALLRLDKCQEDLWCKVEDEESGIVGYALQTLLWGAEPL